MRNSGVTDYSRPCLLLLSWGGMVRPCPAILFAGFATPPKIGFKYCDVAAMIRVFEGRVGVSPRDMNIC